MIRDMEIRAYGKINLSLDVVGKRDDGFHEIETVMQKIYLYDQINLNWEPSDKAGVTVEIKTSKPYLPTDQRNLAYKAANLLIERFRSEIKGGTLKINIIKNIPVSAGLAGGSSNGAAVLIGLNKLWNLGLSTKRLCRMGQELGSDVPFCVLTQNTPYRCSLASGRGEILSPLRAAMNKYIVLAKPAFGVSTKEVFMGIDDCCISQRPDNGELVKGLKNRDYGLVYGNMVNVLELYTLKKYEAVRKLKEHLQETAGVKKVLMSGSGPTVFGVYNTREEARNACKEIRKLKYEAYWVSTMGK